MGISQILRLAKGELQINFLSYNVQVLIIIARAMILDQSI